MPVGADAYTSASQLAKFLPNRAVILPVKVRLTLMNIDKIMTIIAIIIYHYHYRCDDYFGQVATLQFYKLINVCHICVFNNS